MNTRLTLVPFVLCTAALVAVGCTEAPKAPETATAAPATAQAATTSTFLHSGYGASIAVEIEDAAGARIMKLSGDGKALKLKGPDGAGILEATAGKHGKVSYVHSKGTSFEVRDSDDDANRFKIKSSTGNTLLKIKRAGGKLKVQSGEDGPDVVVIKGDADKMKLMVGETEMAAVKRAESGKFKVKAPNDTELFKGDGPVASGAYLLPAMRGQPPVDADLFDVLFCELLRRGW